MSRAAVPPSSSRAGGLLAGIPEGLIGVLVFSLTVPTMRIAVRGLDPVVVGVGRMALAAIPAAILLKVIGSPRLTRRQIGSLLAVAGCLGIGFSWLSALALRDVSSHHAAIVIGGIPLATALWSSLRSGQRQPPLFWGAAATGSLIVIAYGLGKSGEPFRRADLLLLMAAACCGIGYAEGARLGREIGSAVLTCWVPIVAFPAALVLCAGKLPPHFAAVPPGCWLALLYNALFSSFIGFLFWYRGLARGGAARIGQIQLAQPFFTLILSVLLLRERVLPADWWAAGGVVGCIALAQLAARRKSATRPAVESVSY